MLQTRLLVLSRYTGAAFARQATATRSSALLASYAAQYSSVAAPLASAVPPSFRRQFSWTPASLNQSAAPLRRNAGMEYPTEDVFDSPAENNVAPPPAAERKPKGGRGAPRMGGNDASNRLFVGGLTDRNRAQVVEAARGLTSLVNSIHETLADGRPRGFLHLTFLTNEEAAAALAQLGSQFASDPTIRFDYAEPIQTTTVWVGGISPEMKQSVLETARGVEGVKDVADRPDADFITLTFDSFPEARNAHQHLTSSLSPSGVRVEFSKRPANDRESRRAERGQREGFEQRKEYREGGEVRERRPREENRDLDPVSDLFVGNIPWKASEEEILRVFDDLPGFLEIYTRRDASGSNNGIARATFATVRDATKALAALQANPASIGDRVLTFEYSRNRSTRPSAVATPQLFCGGLPMDADEVMVREAFRGCEGLEGIEMRGTPPRTPFAILTFQSVHQAQAAIKACHYKPVYPNGPPMRLDYHHQSGKPDTEQYAPTPKLFVGGTKARTREEVRRIFDGKGLLDVGIAINKATGTSRGFAYVTFDSVENATQAMEAVNNQTLDDGSKLRVSYAAPEGERKGSDRGKRYFENRRGGAWGNRERSDGRGPRSERQRRD